MLGRLLASLLVLTATLRATDSDKDFTRDIPALDERKEWSLLDLINYEPLDREARNTDLSGSGSSGDDDGDTLSCNYTISVYGFHRISSTLHTLATKCTSPLDPASTQYNFTVTSVALTAFTTFTGDTSLLFADKFNLGSFHSLNISVTCPYNDMDCDTALPASLVVHMSVLNYTERLLPYGDDLSDKKLMDVDDGTIDVVVNGDRPLPIYNETYWKVYVSNYNIYI